MARGFMPIGTFRVIYTNGETAETKSNFLGLCEIERRWPNSDSAPGVQAIGVAVWYYLGCPGGDLDAWLATVYNVEPVADDEEADTEVPTQPAVGAA